MGLYQKIYDVTTPKFMFDLWPHKSKYQIKMPIE